MIKAIVFDCFGVLSVDGWLPYKDKYFSEDKEKYEQATTLNRSSDAGLLSYEEFVQGVADLAKIPLIEARRQIENNPPNLQLFKYITDELKPKFKIGLLSNAAADWLDELFSPNLRKLFDATALSCELGFIKPDPRTYTTIAERLGVEPQECVFIDDQERYCTGANEVGMKSVIYKNIDQCKSDIEAILSSS